MLIESNNQFATPAALVPDTQTNDLDVLEVNFLPHVLFAARFPNCFKPFGAHIGCDGEFSLGTADGNSLPEVLSNLMSGMNKMAEIGRIRAGAVAYVWLDEKSDPRRIHKNIACILETKDGHIRLISMPYLTRLVCNRFGPKKVTNSQGHQIFMDVPAV